MPVIDLPHKRISMASFGQTNESFFIDRIVIWKPLEVGNPVRDIAFHCSVSLFDRAELTVLRPLVIVFWIPLSLSTDFTILVFCSRIKAVGSYAVAVLILEDRKLRLEFCLLLEMLFDV